MRIGFIMVIIACTACGSAYSQGASGPAGVTRASTGYADDGYAEYAGEVAMGSAPAADSAGGMGGGDWDFEDMPNEMLQKARPAQIAQAVPPSAQSPDGNTTPPAPTPEATDAVETSGPLLIYTADIHLGVFEVEATQNRIVEELAEIDGFMTRRTDDQLVVRVPARHFRTALERIEGAGDVLHRNVQAQDVSEEFRDLAIRIRNSEVMRDRLERLLTRADSVEAALAIERELQRLTESIETMKGRQRFLADRIAFSTITVHFRPMSTEAGPDGFVLPFDWLNELGLSNLMRL